MKLSGAYLKVKIEENHAVLQQNRISGEDSYLRPVFLCKEEIEGHVVVVEKWSEELPERLKQKEVFLIFAGIRPETELRHPFICVEEQDAGKIFNDLTRIYDECDAWSEQLRTLLMNNESIGKILRMSAAFIGNPLTVMGQDYTFIADADTEELPEHQQIFIDERVNVHYMNEMIEYKAAMHESEWPILYPAFITGCRTMSADLCTSGKKTHRLVVTEAFHTIGECDFCLLRELSVYLEYVLSHMPSVLEKNGLEDILLTALSDSSADYLQVSRKMNQLGWSSKHEYFCLVLQILYEEESSMTIHGIRRYMKREFPDSCSFEFEGYIVTFFNLTKLDMEEEEVGRKLTYFIRDSYLKAGYSRKVRGHMALRRQFLQGRISLEVGTRLKPYVWIYRFNQIVMPYIMEQSTKTLPGRMLCHEGVLELMRIDEESHSQYIQTLRAYLDNQLNATKTANDLFIHRSTFLYRLDKIKEVLQSNLDDPEEIFYLNYSLRVLEQE